MFVVGIMAVSLCVAAILTLTFEMPFTRVEKLVVGRILGAVMNANKSVESKTAEKEKQSAKMDTFRDEMKSIDPGSPPAYKDVSS